LERARKEKERELEFKKDRVRKLAVEREEIIRRNKQMVQDMKREQKVKTKNERKINAEILKKIELYEQKLNENKKLKFDLENSYAERDKAKANNQIKKKRVELEISFNGPELA
jgi:hypothetical protein